MRGASSLEAGAHRLSVFRFAGFTTFPGDSPALWQNSMWHKGKWSRILKSTT